MLVALFLLGPGVDPAAAQDRFEPLAIGEPAPLTDHEVTDVSDEQLTLSGVAGESGLLVVFTCNTCPWANKWEDRFNPLALQAEQLGIGVIFLNPNEALRDDEESMAAMKDRADEAGYEFYYAVDRNHKLADALGATRTPDTFLFDSNLELVYRGAIDDNARDAASVRESYLSSAMNRMAASETIGNPVQKAIGCTIKRVREES